jgi:hypothetical protein
MQSIPARHAYGAYIPSLHGLASYLHEKSVKMPHVIIVQLSRGSRQSAQGSGGAAAKVLTVRPCKPLKVMYVLGWPNVFWGVLREEVVQRRAIAR